MLNLLLFQKDNSSWMCSEQELKNNILLTKDGEHQEDVVAVLEIHKCLKLQISSFSCLSSVSLCVRLFPSSVFFPDLDNFFVCVDLSAEDDMQIDEKCVETGN